MADPIREKPGGDAIQMATGNICRVTTGRTTSWTTWRTPESPAWPPRLNITFCC
jgi:hypothetical protein